MDNNLYLFESVFYESSDSDRIKEYREAEAKLSKMVKDGNKEKVARFFKQYFRFCMYENIICGVVFPPLLLSAAIDYLIADCLENKSKRGQLTKLKRKVDAEIKVYQKDINRYTGKERSNLEKNIAELQKISNKLDTEISKENPHMPDYF